MPSLGLLTLTETFLFLPMLSVSHLGIHQSSRFNQLDLLSIGQDHVFVIHRELLLQDIYDFLSYSPKGLQRVFVNVDYRLPQPEIIPGNRYKPLEDYLREVLLPEIKHRIATWDQAECVSRPLEISATLSMVTLVGWLSSYPVNYVHPTRERSEKRKLEGGDNDDVDDEDDDQDCGRNCLANQLLVLTSVQLEPSETIHGLKDHLMMSFSYPAELAERFMDRSLLSPESPCSPCEPSETCWPGAGASKNVRRGDGSESQIDADDDDGDEDDDAQEFVDASDAEFTEPEGDAEEDPSTLETSRQDSAMSSGSRNPSSPLKISVTSAATTATASTTKLATSPTATSTTTTTDTICLPDCHPDCMPGSLAEATTATTTSSQSLQTQFNPQSQTPPQPQPNSSRPRPLQGRPRSHTYAHPEKPVVSRPRSRRLPSSASYDQNKPLPFNNPDILAAGRSFLHQLHTRFQKQTVWKAWEVGQEKVTLPVVAM
ncbi:unnamed protein product [Mortierella alpina]